MNPVHPRKHWNRSIPRDMATGMLTRPVLIEVFVP